MRRQQETVRACSYLLLLLWHWRVRRRRRLIAEVAQARAKRATLDEQQRLEARIEGVYSVAPVCVCLCVGRGKCLCVSDAHISAA